MRSVLFGAVAILAFLVCYVALDSRPAIAFAVLTIGAPGIIAAARFQRSGLIDALGLFCLAFVAYNGVILLRLATMPENTAVSYPWTFTQEHYAQAGLIDAIAALTICVTSLIVTALWKPRHTATLRQTGSRGCHIAWFPAGLVMYVLGLAMYFQQWQQAGGYLAGLKAGRSIRFEVFGSNGLSWPYTAFAVPGLAAMWYASAQHRLRAVRWSAWVALLLWCALLLPQGDRLYVIEALIAVVAVHCSCRRRPLALTTRNVAALLLIYVVSATFGQFRGLFAPLAGGGMTWSEARQCLTSSCSVDWIKPERSELAGPYFSLLQVSAAPSEELLQGKNSVVEALLTILPKAVYPGQKPTLLSHRFETSVYRGRGTAPGWGFSAVAEAYLNLGYAGVIVMFVLWTFLFSALDAVKRLPVVFSVLLPEVVNANRMDFRNVYGEAAYYVFGVGLTFLLVKLLGVFFQKSPQGYSIVYNSRV